MSTVPEAIVARQCVGGWRRVSCIANLAASRNRKALSHAEGAGKQWAASKIWPEPAPKFLAPVMVVKVEKNSRFGCF